MAGAIRIPNGSDKSDTSASLSFFLNTEITEKADVSLFPCFPCSDKKTLCLCVFAFKKILIR